MKAFLTVSSLTGCVSERYGYENDKGYRQGDDLRVDHVPGVAGEAFTLNIFRQRPNVPIPVGEKGASRSGI